MVAHSFNSSTWEAETGGSLWVQDQPGLHREFQDSQGYVERDCFKQQQLFGSVLVKEETDTTLFSLISLTAVGDSWPTPGPTTS